MKPADQQAAIAAELDYPRTEPRWLVPVGHGVSETAMTGFATEAEANSWAAKCLYQDVGQPQPYDHVAVAPDFLNDLNAMAEAEQTLPDWNDLPLGHNRWRYLDYLAEICGGISRASCATAAQRAEAFLRVIGKWQDTACVHDIQPDGDYGVPTCTKCGSKEAA